MINTREFYDFLGELNINFFTGVPDSLLKQICACISDNENENHIIAANEGNAVGLATGYHLATNKIPMVYLQNSGLGNTVNPLISLTSDTVYSIPMLMMIGWRGQPGVKDEPQHVNQGAITEELLNVIGVEYEILSFDIQEAKSQTKQLVEKAIKENKPKAILIRKNTFEEYKYDSDTKYQSTVSREEALDVLLRNIEDNDYIFSTTGKTSREVFELREKYNQGHNRDFLTVGSMGHTSSIAMGFSKYNNNNVICIDGDGALLMHMGSLPINAVYGKNNFKYLLINNYAHESVGGQKTIANTIDFMKLFDSVGFKNKAQASTLPELEKILNSSEFKTESYALEVLVKLGSRKDLGRPTITPKQGKKEFDGNTIMDALIFNSGFGSRIADLIKNSHKSLLDINGETILARQLRILSDFNIDRVIITTGPNADKLHFEVSKKNYPFEVLFVHSSKYAETNYIYSMFLASEYLLNDTLIMHGDLVFNSNIIKRLINTSNDCVLIDSNKKAYEKDFKAIVDNKKIRKISTQITEFDYGLQPVYKLSNNTLNIWLDKVNNYVEKDMVRVYAEDALNDLLLNTVTLDGLDIASDFCKEIDNPEDLENVKNEILTYDSDQEIIYGNLENSIEDCINPESKVFVVTFGAIESSVSNKLNQLKNTKTIIYNDANPEKQDIIECVSIFEEYNPDYIVSVGGGSVIDFAKCLLDFSNVIAKHIAVPTTCGTGSESTKFAVYYIDGIKQSLNKNIVLPSYAILDVSLLVTLPRKVLISSVLDAFAQSIESFWSNKATMQSQQYSLEAIRILYPILIEGVQHDPVVLKQLQHASNLAGKAINITTTTAAHALSYNITKIFGVSHGMAVCMTLPFLWEMHLTKTHDFDRKMKPILDIVGTESNEELLHSIKLLFQKYNVYKPLKYSKDTLDFLVQNVNLERLSNNPYHLSEEDIKSIYVSALGNPE